MYLLLPSSFLIPFLWVQNVFSLNFSTASKVILVEVERNKLRRTLLSYIACWSIFLVLTYYIATWAHLNFTFIHITWWRLSSEHSKIPGLIVILCYPQLSSPENLPSCLPCPWINSVYMAARILLFLTCISEFITALFLLKALPTRLGWNGSLFLINFPYNLLHFSLAHLIRIIWRYEI